MALVNRTIRVSDAEWGWIAREAAEQGVSVSDYVRQAALFRSALDRAVRDPEFGEAFAGAYGQAGRIVHDYMDTK